jgi:hypothetical protein
MMMVFNGTMSSKNISHLKDDYIFFLRRYILNHIRDVPNDIWVDKATTTNKLAGGIDLKMYDLPHNFKFKFFLMESCVDCVVFHPTNENKISLIEFTKRTPLRITIPVKPDPIPSPTYLSSTPTSSGGAGAGAGASSRRHHVHINSGERSELQKVITLLTNIDDLTSYLAQIGKEKQKILEALATQERMLSALR